MNSTNLDFIALNIISATLLTLGCFFCNFDVHQSLSIFHTLDYGFID